MIRALSEKENRNSFARYGLASIAPSLWYMSLWFIYSSLPEQYAVYEHEPFYNWTAAMMMLAMTQLKPLDQFSLAMLFEPVKYFIGQEIKRLNEMQAKLPFCERGNFLPVAHEVSYDIKAITHGSVPKDISGVYM